MSTTVLTFLISIQTLLILSYAFKSLLLNIYKVSNLFITYCVKVESIKRKFHSQGIITAVISLFVCFQPNKNISVNIQFVQPSGSSKNMKDFYYKIIVDQSRLHFVTATVSNTVLQFLLKAYIVIVESILFILTFNSKIHITCSFDFSEIINYSCEILYLYFKVMK